MKQILRINTSLFSDNSVSNQLLDEIEALLEEKFGETTIIRRDLARESVPHLDAEWVTALGAKPVDRTPAQQQMLDYSNEQIAQVQAADILLLGAPMYNFSVPSVLKAWFDHLARAGVTFQYTANGPEGLLKNKKVYLVTTRGGKHKDQETDSQIPFVKTFLSFVGLDDVEIIYAEGLNMSGLRDKGIHEARQTIQALLAA